ncbi:MAG TPA: hypothetical protein DEG43_05015 [Acidimicrobiaceae bacterium]|nr:hypothetical protein [Acidimicrobiaceae bacterium]
MKFAKQVGMIIVRNNTTVSGPMCRECGLSTARSFQATNLWAGWWGLISLVVNPFKILGNFMNSRKVKRLSPPVEPSKLAPLSPGRPLWQRPAMALPVAFVILLGWTIYQTSSLKRTADLVVGECISSRVAGGVARTMDCRDPHDMEVIGVVDDVSKMGEPTQGPCDALASELRVPEMPLEDLQIVYFQSSDKSQPKLICAVRRFDKQPMTGPLSGG